MLLMVSDSMDTNKKRNEHELIRLPSTARKSTGLESVFAAADVMKGNSELPSASVKVFQAFSKDIKNMRKRGFTEKEVNNTAFVSTKTFTKIFGKKVSDAIIKDGISIKLNKAVKATTALFTGADPEFLLFNNDNEIVPAYKMLQKNGLIGADGAMIEIRPKPSKSIDGLVSNMKSIFRNKGLTDSIKDLNWKAGVYHVDDTRDYPVGGHIHIGNAPGVEELSINERCYMFAVMNKILDELLSVPMIKLDGKDLGKSRRSDCKMAMGDHGYGYYGAWRMCDGRLEYRTLSGLWLTHPELAHAVIGCSKAITDEMFNVLTEKNFSKSLFKHKDINFKYLIDDYVSRNDFHDYKVLYNQDFDGWKDIKLSKVMGCTKGSRYMSSILNESKTGSITKAYINAWYKRMRSLSTYKTYSNSIDYLYNVLMLPNSKLAAISTDIKENWTSDNSLKF